MDGDDEVRVEGRTTRSAARLHHGKASIMASQIHIEGHLYLTLVEPM